MSVTVQVKRVDDVIGTISSDGQRVTVDPPDHVTLKNMAQTPVVGRDVDGVLDPHKDPDGFVCGLQYAYKSHVLHASAPVTETQAQSIGYVEVK